MDNIGVGVVTSTRLKERYMACKNTWSKDFQNVFFFGGYLQDDNLISISQAGEDYNSHFLKQQLGFKYMFEKNPNFDWYCMTSCDAILFKNSTLNEIYKYDHNQDFLLALACGTWTDTPYFHAIDNPSDNSFTAIAGGGGFFISNSLMKKCYQIIDSFNENWIRISGPNYPYSDVAFAYMVFKYLNIRLTNMPYLLGQPPSHYLGAISGDENTKWYVNFPIPLTEALKRPMSFHYIKPHEMMDVYNKYKS